MPVKENGGLGNPVSIIQHYGGGPNKKRQAGPHVHSAVFSPDGKFLCAADLGTDTETLYAFDSNNGHLDTVPFQTIHTRPGTGPRHFIYSDNGKYAYLVTEMGGSISAYQVKRGRLKLMQELSALPDGFKGNNTSADLHISPDGTFLYMTNRGKESNSITTFKIDQRSGRLQKTGYQPTLGNFPRNFVISPGGRYLLVAHQLSNDVVVFERNSITGQLTDTGKRIAIPAPVCLKWINR
jgi:6-phosphogluconolactonase